MATWLGFFSKLLMLGGVRQPGTLDRSRTPKTANAEPWRFFYVLGNLLSGDRVEEESKEQGVAVAISSSDLGSAHYRNWYNGGHRAVPRVAKPV